MSYHYGTTTLEALNKACPGTAYLRKVIKAKALEFDVDRIEVDLGDDDGPADHWTIANNGKVTPSQAMAISLWAVELDGQVLIEFYKSGKRVGWLIALYDGPYYPGENAEEIINDYSTALGELPNA